MSQTITVSELIEALKNVSIPDNTYVIVNGEFGVIDSEKRTLFNGNQYISLVSRELEDHIAWLVDQ